MTKKRVEEGLAWDEMITIQNLLISFQSGIRTKEELMLGIVRMLGDRKTVNTRVWEELKDLTENVGFDWVESKKMVEYFKENYRRRQN